MLNLNDYVLPMNPIDQSPSNQNHIRALIEYMKLNQRMYIAKDESCELMIEGQLHQVQLERGLVLYSKKGRQTKPEKNYDQVMHLAVLKNEPLGKGAFGEVHAIKGHWRLDNDQLEFKQKTDKAKRRVVKIFEPTKQQITDAAPKKTEHRLSAAEKEFEIASHIPHLGADIPLIKVGQGSAMIMRRLANTSLADLVTKVRTIPNFLTATQYLQLSIHLLRRIKSQVFDIQRGGQGLVHRDLKPNNILCSYHQGFDCQVIDYGFSTTVFSQISARTGTPLYKDPELVELSFSADSPSFTFASQHHDLFSYAMILLILSGETVRFKIRDINQLRIENQDINFTDFLSCYTDFTEKQKQELYTLLRRMTRYSYRDRLPGYYTILNTLTTMLYERYAHLKSTNSERLNQRIHLLKLKAAARRTGEDNALDHEFEVAEFFSDMLRIYHGTFLGIDLNSFLNEQLKDPNQPLAKALAQFEQRVKQTITEKLPNLAAGSSLASHRADFLKQLKQPLIPNRTNYQLAAEELVYLQQRAIIEEFKEACRVKGHDLDGSFMEFLQRQFRHAGYEYIFQNEPALIMPITGGDPLSRLISLEKLKNAPGSLNQDTINQKIDSLAAVTTSLGITGLHSSDYKNKGINGLENYTQSLLSKMQDKLDKALQGYTAKNHSWLIFKKSEKRSATIRELKKAIDDALREALKKDKLHPEEIRANVLQLIRSAKVETQSDHAQTGLTFFKSCLPIPKSRLATHLAHLESQFNQRPQEPALC